jgi:hypothetical protein
VLLDGKDVRNHNLRALRRVVSQEPFLFTASIHENIAILGEFHHFCRFILTEWYFQFTVQSFDGILRELKLSVVFYGERDLSMLHNQFSLLYTIDGVRINKYGT